MGFALLIVVLGLMLWMFLQGGQPNELDFQRMADEFTAKRAFVDCEGHTQTDCDILIDLWLKGNKRGRNEEAVEGIDGAVERYYSGVEQPPR